MRNFSSAITGEAAVTGTLRGEGFSRIIGDEISDSKTTPFAFLLVSISILVSVGSALETEISIGELIFFTKVGFLW